MKRFEVEIEKIVAGGDGLARHEGRVVFVPGTVPGERHQVETVHEKKDFVRARSVALLEASEHRREAACPYYGRCGWVLADAPVAGGRSRNEAWHLARKPPAPADLA